MKKDKIKSKNTDYSCDDYDDFFEDDIAETESDYDDISDFEPPRDVPKGRNDFYCAIYVDVTSVFSKE